MRRIILTIFIGLFPLFLFSQGNLLVLSNDDCTLIINGDRQVALEKEKPLKLTLPFGEHVLQASNNSLEITEFVTLVDSDQKLVRIEFSIIKMKKVASGLERDIEKSTVPVLLTSLDLSLSGGVNAFVDDPSFSVEDSELFFYLSKDDVIRLNAEVKSKKGVFNLEMYSYPDLNSIYSKSKLRALENVEIEIKETGIYVFRIGTSAVFDKTLEISIVRIPRPGA